MSYQIGDIIVLLHSNEEGEVIDIINDNMVMVCIGSVQFPVRLDQIKLQYLVPKNETKSEDVKSLKALNQNESLESENGVYVTICPVFSLNDLGEKTTSSFKIYLSNKTSLHYNFIFTFLNNSKEKISVQSIINSTSDFFLDELLLDDINDYPVLQFDFSLTQLDKRKADSFSKLLKLKPKEIFKKVEKIKKEKKSSFSIPVFEVYPNRYESQLTENEVPQIISNLYELSEARKFLDKPIDCIDLHIEKLTDHWQQLSNLEILAIQLQEFDKYFDLALAHRQLTLTVIHGVGEGVLKNEIQAKLKQSKEVASFEDDYDPQFGYGATKIFFQRPRI